MSKKRVIITLSKVFPATHSRAGKPTYFKERLFNAVKGYDGHQIAVNTAGGKTTEVFVNGGKKHTIRANYDRWAHNIAKISEGGFYLSIRQWSGKPYASKQVEIMQLHDTVGVQRVELKYSSHTGNISVKIDGRNRSDIDWRDMAQNDGLTPAAFKEWFFGKNPIGDVTFTGAIIHFTKFRY